MDVPKSRLSKNEKLQGNRVLNSTTKPIYVCQYPLLYVEMSYWSPYTCIVCFPQWRIQNIFLMKGLQVPQPPSVRVCVCACECVKLKTPEMVKELPFC